MSHSIFDNISSLNEELKNTTNSDFSQIETNTISEQSQFGNNIYKLFDALVLLFTELNLLTLKEDENVDKFRFIHAYPDEVREKRANTVTYNIIKRNPRVTQNYSLNTRSVTKMKPSVIGEEYNIVTGNVDEFYNLEFDNIISITVFSTKARVLNNLARLIEAIFFKYSSYIKKFVDESIYLGMGDIQFIDGYDEQQPIFARELQYKVLTTEVYKLELEQVKSINVQLN